ncbi:MAG: glycosyltransferase family 4 protein [Candidatus Magasanikbacteria bacterium]|nr:glycosyltransferase family 4 protein [Candidatus Magasanikbacteria bacterium]
MRIGFDQIAEISQGGNGRYSQNLFSALQSFDSGHEFVPFGYFHDWVRGELVKPAFLTSFGLSISPSLLQCIQDRLFRLSTKRSKIDIFHFTNPMNFIASSIPYVVTIHDLAPLRNTSWVKPRTVDFFKENIEKIICGAASVIAVSEFTKKDILDRYSISPDKVQVIGEAASPVFFRDEDREYLKNKFQLDQFLLYAGQLQERKNIRGLLNAYSGLGVELQSVYPLVVVGRASSDAIANDFLDLADRLCIKPYVHWLGRVEDNVLRKLYSCARLFVYPSFFEGFGLPPLEAMACGTPVIASKDTAVEEVVGHAGLLCDPNDPESIADMMEVLVTQEDVYRQLQTATLVQAKKFTWSDAAKKTVSVYVKKYDK